MTSDDRVSRARRGLGLYFAVVVPLSAVIEWKIATSGGTISDHPGLVLALMWTPALAMLVARVALREGARDVSFRLRAPKGHEGPKAPLARPLLVAWLSPVLVGALAYGAAWVSGIEPFSPKAMATFGLSHTPAGLRFVVSLVLNLTLGTALSAITAAGEELGWRGYMLTRLVDAKVPYPVLVSTFVWGLWHAPLIAAGVYAAGPRPALSVACFFASIVGGGALAAYSRLASGSVWPAVLFHAAWNAVIQGTFDGFTAGGDAAHTSNVLTGESGVLVAVVSVLVAVALVRGRHVMFRSPSDPMGQPRPLFARTLSDDAGP